MKLKLYLFITVLIYTLSANAQLPFTYDGFDYGNGAQISGQTGGFGWQGGWQASTGAEAFYTVSNTSPFSYTNGATLPITPGYMTGSSSGNIIGRYFNTATNGPYASYLNASGSIGKGPTNSQLIFTFHITKSANNNDQIYYALSNGLDNTSIQNPTVAFGFFGARSISNGTRYWTYRLGDNYYLATPIVPNQKEYFGINYAFSATNIYAFNMSRNAPIQNGNSVSNLVGTILTSSAPEINRPFKSVFFYSEGTGGAIDEFLVGPNFNSVGINILPPTVLNGVNSSITGAPGTSTSLNDTWRLNGNGATTSTVQFIGTIDNQDLNIRTNNVNRLLIGKDGNTHFYGNSIIDGVFNANNGLNVNGTVINNGQPVDFSKLNYWTQTGNNLSSTNTGKVGIGISNPLAKLQVEGDELIHGSLTVSGDIFNNNTKLDFSSLNTWKSISNQIILLASNIDSEAIVTYTNMCGITYKGNPIVSNPSGQQRGYQVACQLHSIVALMDSTLNVGIGTDYPVRKLDVRGDVNVSGDIYKNNIKLDFSSLNAWIWDTGEILTLGTNINSESIGYYTDICRFQYYGIPTVENPTGQQNGTIITCKIRDRKLTVADTTLNVGIGTSHPSKKLDVSGDVNISGDLYKNSIKLDFSSLNAWTENSGIILIASSVNSELIGIYAMQCVNEYQGIPIVTQRTNSYYFQVSCQVGNPRVILTDTIKNVGIGTKNPTSKLDVLGNGTSAEIRLRHINETDSTLGVVLGQKSDLTAYLIARGRDMQITSGWDKMLLLGDGNYDDFGGKVVIPGGNVGIGTITPSTKLEINGVGGTNVDFIVNGRLKSNNNDGGLWISSDRFVGGHTTNKIGFYNNGWQLTVQNDGNVGIGTLIPSVKLDVNGTIKGTQIISSGNIVALGRMDATEFHACLSPGTCPDYVFEKDYKLLDLHSLKLYLEKNKHLPDVPLAKEMEHNGMNLNEMNLLLLKKVEEITLYVLQLESEIQKIKATK